MFCPKRFKKTPINSIILTLTILLTTGNYVNAQEEFKANGKFEGKIFTNFNIGLTNGDKTKNFELKRAYFGYKYEFAPHLIDVMSRRTEIAIKVHHSKQRIIAKKIADIMGQEIFTSKPLMAAMPSKILATSPYSLSVEPKTLTIMGVPNFIRFGIFSLISALTPMFCRPIELSIPPVVSTRRGGGFPECG